MQCDVAGTYRSNRRGFGCRYPDGGRLCPRREATTPGNLDDADWTAHLLLPHVPRGTQAGQHDSPFLPDREIEVVRELVHPFTVAFHASRTGLLSPRPPRPVSLVSAAPAWP